jgi:hypothetical protein
MPHIHFARHHLCYTGSQVFKLSAPPEYQILGVSTNVLNPLIT